MGVDFLRKMGSTRRTATSSKVYQLKKSFKNYLKVEENVIERCEYSIQKLHNSIPRKLQNLNGNLFSTPSDISLLKSELSPTGS